VLTHPSPGDLFGRAVALHLVERVGMLRQASVVVREKLDMLWWVSTSEHARVQAFLRPWIRVESTDVRIGGWTLARRGALRALSSRRVALLSATTTVCRALVCRARARLAVHRTSVFLGFFHLTLLDI